MCEDNNTISKRPEFLIEIYKQMMNDINRHIMVVWQSIGAVVSSFAFLALTEKNVISLDVATTLIVIICTWSAAHAIDAGYWYNRNLCIIANIERQFLREEDLKNIHYYFGNHRPDNKMLTHLILQLFLSIGIACSVISFHFFKQVTPGFGLPFCDFNVVIALPYGVVIISIILLFLLARKRKANYEEFIKNSPGIKINISGINYGSGHGFK